jgi:hypothetical protein
MPSPKLFAVYLGGRAPRCNTELHDVVFVTGDAIESTYEQLLEKWFGSPEGLHIDSWMELDVVDGHRVSLLPVPVAGASAKLFFVNLGAYDSTDFTEYHSNRFVVAKDAPQAKTLAKKQLAGTGLLEIHKDRIHEVDDCVQVGSVEGLHVALTKTDETSSTKPRNEYHVVPKPVIAAFVARRASADK